MLWWLVSLRDIAFGFGGISTDTDSLAFRTLTGWHSCDGAAPDVLRSPFENRILLHFGRSSSISYCSIRLNRTVLDEWNRVIRDNSFVRFTNGIENRRVAILDPSTRERFIFSDFLITFDTNDRFAFIVQPQQSHRIAENALINITFSVVYSEMGSREIERTYTSLAVFCGGFFMLLLDLGFILGYRSRFPKVSVLQLGDFWRISVNFRRMNFIGQCAFQFIITIILSSIGLLVANGFGVVWVTSSIVGCLLAIFGIERFYRFLGCDYCPSQVASFCCFLATLLLQILTAFSRSFCGYSAVQTLLLNLLWLLGLAAASQIRLSKVSSERRSPVQFQKSGNRIDFKAMPIDVACGIISGLIMKAAVDHVYDCLLYDHQLDWLFVGAVAFLVSAVAALRAVCRTVRLVQLCSAQWQEGHVVGGGVVAAICLLWVKASCDFCELQSGMFCGCYAVFLLAVIFTWYISVSYYTAFYFMYKLTSKETVEPDSGGPDDPLLE
jgi:hypothetical protein